MKTFPTFCFLFVFFAFFAGQSFAVCTLTTQESPKLLNLKLGMTPAEVNNSLDRSVKVKVKTDEQFSYTKSFLKKGKAKRRLAGARALFLRFYEKRLYQIEVFYHAGYRWQNLESFVLDYSTENAFSPDNWKTKHGYARAECVGFTLAADYILNPRIELTDENAVEAIAEAKKAGTNLEN